MPLPTTANENNAPKILLPAPSAFSYPDALPLITLEQQVLFPLALVQMRLTDVDEMHAVRDALRTHKLIAVLTQSSPADGKEGPVTTYDVGCISRILHAQQTQENTQDVVLQGLHRFRSQGLIRRVPYKLVRVTVLEDYVTDAQELNALHMTLRRQLNRLFELLPNIPDAAKDIVRNVQEPGYLADLVAFNLNLPLEEKIKLLELNDQVARLRRLVYLVQRELEVLELSNKIQQDVKSTIEKGQREYFLRQQLRAIREELGEAEGTASVIQRYREKLQALHLPEEVHKEIEREINRLEHMNEASAEYSVILTYLDTVLELPWNVITEDVLDILHAESVLNEDHYGLEKVKRRILEFLSVRKLKPDAHGAILCFVGPPGVGKTSLGKSIARAMGRRFIRIALGGVHDEAEIRGHRKTYVGALPGRIIQGIRKAGSRNPVFMLDEIDKVGADFRGDPASALLEVLDPAQNYAFVDNYLNVPFDLSRVLFIATANVTDTIPWALRDRMETIEIAGYTDEEKLYIAKRFLLPRQIEEHGLRRSQLRVGAHALRRVIREYTREAGVRNLEREIAALCRAAAHKIAMGKATQITVTDAELEEVLGKPKYYYDTTERTRVPGVAVGLAWTPTGGDILFIEATRMPGRGELILTGQLGDVMKESARAALSFLRANAETMGLDPAQFNQYDVHVHVPAGAVPKDGPSAGITILTALASLFSARPVSGKIAMTGEITLRGNVLAVGGIKEKLLAAARSGISRVIVPERCRNDVDEAPASVRKVLKIHYVSRVEEVLQLTLRLGAPMATETKPAPNRREGPPSPPARRKAAKGSP